MNTTYDIKWQLSIYSDMETIYIKYYFYPVFLCINYVYYILGYKKQGCRMWGRENTWIIIKMF